MKPIPYQIIQIKCIEEIMKEPIGAYILESEVGWKILLVRVYTGNL